MRRKNRAEMQAETRERLLASASAVFSQKGFSGATIDEIAEGAGFSRGAFYSNFATKEDLAVELMGRQMAQEIERATQIAGGVSGPPETMAERLSAVYPMHDKVSEWELLRLELLLLSQRNPGFAEKSQDLYRQQRERSSAMITQLFARAGRVPPADVDLLSKLLLSLRVGAAMLHGPTGPVPLGEIVTLLFRVLTAVAAPVETPKTEVV